MSGNLDKEPENDPYEALKVPLSASDTDISKAYKKLALKFHPDKQQGLSGPEKEQHAHTFHRIQEARSFLLDPENYKAREKYKSKRMSLKMREKADEVRNQAMSDRRKRMRDELNKHEEPPSRESTSKKRPQDKTREHDESKIGPLRSKGEAMRESMAARAAEQEATAAKLDLENRQVRLKWSRKRISVSPSEASIASELKRFGNIEAVDLLGAKGNMALVTFSDPSSCGPCVEAYSMSSEMRAHLVGNRRQRDEEKNSKKDVVDRSDSNGIVGTKAWRLNRDAKRELFLRQAQKGDPSSRSDQDQESKRVPCSPFPPVIDKVDARIQTLLQRLEAEEMAILGRVI